jgi:hypothetical protein
LNGHIELTDPLSYLYWWIKKEMRMDEQESDYFWREKASALEREVSELKLELLDGERRLLEALVDERKRVKQLSEDLNQMTEKYEMAKQAMTSLTSKCITLEMEVAKLNEINSKNEEFMEKLAAQRAADEHCKRALDEEVRKTKQQMRLLMEENGTLALRLEISEGGGI